MTMRPLTGLLPVEQAMALLLSSVRPLDQTETVPLAEAMGRVVAGDVLSPLDVPPFPRAAMDGYALRAEERGPLLCIEAVHAGEVAIREVGPGTCIEVATGAPLPTGADAVLRVEDTSRVDDEVTLHVAARPGQSITRQGADMTAGGLVVAGGTVLNPSRVGALAAVGLPQVRVYRRPRVKLASSGNEIVPPGQALGPGQIYDVNAFTLAALLRGAGCEVEILPTLPDRLDVLKETLASALDADVVVVSGGSSVGVRDLTIDAVGALGEVLFHGLAIKPGKPTMLGRVQGKPVVGMPGYPTSCLSNGYMFLLPMVARLGRWELVRRTVRGRLVRDVRSEAGKLQVYTVRVLDGTVEPAFKESGVISSMSQADGYMLIPPQATTVAAGTEVEVVLF
ncbi:MAG TPA: gephyrin-like molybdotransferase Glp [Candidatus Xenobia bacterium]|jgi:molybdopterin molybdotransferase